MMTDPTTEQMRAETGHDCPACPIEARHIGAVAHNAAGAIRAALDGTGGWDRADRKLIELERAVNEWQTIVDTHFDALNSWRRPTERIG